jgi:hypothetical protein
MKDFGARYYGPGIQRWQSADSVMAHPYDPQSLNKYAYVRNDPVNWVDRDGRVPVPTCVYNEEGECIDTVIIDDGTPSDSNVAIPKKYIDPFVTAINRAADNALKLLSGKCAELLQGNYKGDLADLLKSIQEKNDIRLIPLGFGTRDSNGLIDVIMAFTPPVQTPERPFFYINRSGPFENPSAAILNTPSGQQYFNYLQWWNGIHESNLDTLGFQTTIILHELGHITGAFGEDAKSGKSTDYSKDVIRDCLK